MLSILWFTLFAFLSGFSTSYAVLFGLRALFGIGMGGVGGWNGRFLPSSTGQRTCAAWFPVSRREAFHGRVIVASLVFRYVYPIFSGRPGSWLARDVLGSELFQVFLSFGW